MRGRFSMPPGMPSLEGILEVKTSSFRKFIPDTGWTAWLLVYIFRRSGEIDRFEMTEAQFREFQEARGSIVPRLQTKQEENEDAQEQAG